jgi:hypothetical protein
MRQVKSLRITFINDNYECSSLIKNFYLDRYPVIWQEDAAIK